MSIRREVSTIKITLKQARVGAGLTQAEAAEMIDVHVSTYQKFESQPEKMTILQAAKFCKAVGVPLDSVCFLPEKSI